jgi:uncharacterized protein (TIGR03086 family)
MTQPRSTAEVSARYRRLADEFTRRVTAVGPDQWDAPTPCGDWTVRDLVGHVAGHTATFASSIGVEVTLRQSAQEDPVATWTESDQVMQGLLEDPARAEQEYQGYFGPTTFSQTADTFGALDLLVHGWDLARATGQDEQLPADEVRTVHAFALQLGDSLRLEGVCGPLVAVPPDAAEQDRLLGLLGRTP